MNITDQTIMQPVDCKLCGKQDEIDTARTFICKNCGHTNKIVWIPMWERVSSTIDLKIKDEQKEFLRHGYKHNH